MGVEGYTTSFGEAKPPNSTYNPAACRQTERITQFHPSWLGRVALKATRTEETGRGRSTFYCQKGYSDLTVISVPMIVLPRLPAHRRHQAMTQSERQRRKAVTLLIAVRERNDDVMRGLEAERDRLLTQGSLIPSPVWRRRGPKPTKPRAASPDCGQSGHSVRHGLGPAGR
jgi:hypothetical protein